MGKIIVANHLTLDGVMQAPGGADEDPRDGFRHGGWANLHTDPVIAETLGAELGGAGGFLFGRRTYEQFASFWPHQTDGNPYTEMLNNGPKYVSSRTITDPLPWQNSTLLRGEAAETVARLKVEEPGDLIVFGSGDLGQTLRRHGLVDAYVLMIHPLVLGTGRRMFPDGGPRVTLDLVRSVTAPSGVVVATYRPAASGAGDRTG